MPDKVAVMDAFGPTRKLRLSGLGCRFHAGLCATERPERQIPTGEPIEGAGGQARVERIWLAKPGRCWGSA